MKQEEFEKLAEEGFAAIPERFRALIQNVAFLVENEPSKELRQKEGLCPEETLLGYYYGVPATARGNGYGIGPTLPDTITLFQKPIEEAAGSDPERIADIIADTIWHEIAHHFGVDEKEVRKREERRGKHQH